MKHLIFGVYTKIWIAHFHENLLCNFLCIVSVDNSYCCNLWYHNKLNFLWGKRCSWGSFLFVGNYSVWHFLMVFYVICLICVFHFCFDVWQECFCWRFYGIYALFKNAFWLAAKELTNFCFDCLTMRWVEPWNVSLPFPFCFL